MYILWRRGSVPVLSLRRLVDLADLSGSPGESGPVGEEFKDIIGGESRILARARHSPELSK